MRLLRWRDFSLWWRPTAFSYIFNNLTPSLPRNSVLVSLDEPHCKWFLKGQFVFYESGYSKNYFKYVLEILCSNHDMVSIIFIVEMGHSCC